MTEWVETNFWYSKWRMSVGEMHRTKIQPLESWWTRAALISNARYVMALALEMDSTKRKAKERGVHE